MGIFCSRVGKLGVKLGKLGNGRKKTKKIKVLRMSSPIVEIVPTSDDNVFKLSPASQLPYGAKNKNKKVFCFVL